MHAQMKYMSERNNMHLGNVVSIFSHGANMVSETCTEAWWCSSMERVNGIKRPSASHLSAAFTSYDQPIRVASLHTTTPPHLHANELSIITDVHADELKKRKHILLRILLSSPQWSSTINSVRKTNQQDARYNRDHHRKLVSKTICWWNRNEMSEGITRKSTFYITLVVLNQFQVDKSREQRPIPRF